MKDNRVYFEGGRMKRDNVSYLMSKVSKCPPEFKQLADVFFSEIRRMEERIRDVKD
jgi:hypothetical protein